tara:strand:- start:2741 stop:3781 length:1041 start_codon:yes stop_codon:yes gene_type:complete
MKHIRYKNLLTFSKKILINEGLNNFSSNSVSEALCLASLRGVDSHGINLLTHYVNSAKYGRKNKNPNFKFNLVFPSFGVLDADNGFGIAAGYKAINYGIKIAKKNGISAVAVKNSSHCGSLASIALNAAKKDFIVFAFTHADSLLLSFNGKKPYFGTNPICFAAPRIESEPYCLDMSSSKISWNKLLNYKNNKKILPKNTAADKNGKITINPNLAASLYPIGDYKGFGIASMVEILCGIFNGMKFGTSMIPMYNTNLNKSRNLGQFYILMKPNAVIPKNQFKKYLQKMSNEVRKQPAKGAKKVMMPNDKEIKTSKIRLKNGIPINKLLKDQLDNLSSDYKVKISYI